MNRRLLVRAVLSLFVILAFGMFAVAAPVGDLVPPKPERPSAPLIATPAVASQWRIVLAPLVSSTAKTPEPLMVEIRVAKSASLASLIIFWNDGKSAENWISGNTIFEVSRGNPHIYVTDVKLRREDEGNGIYRFNAIYPGFSWLDLKYFVHVVSLNGKKCFYYMDPETSYQAWIDRDTNLPVAFSDRFYKGNYEFLPAPTQELQLPEKFTQKLKRIQQANAR